LRIKGFHQSLRFKATVGIVVAIVAIMSIFYSFQVFRFRKDLIENLRDSSTHYLSDVIKGSLKHAMINRDLAEARYIIETVGKQKGVDNIFLVDKRGEIKMSPEMRRVGEVLNLNDYTCQICHQFSPEVRNKTVIYKEENGQRIFRNVNPIFNEPECYGCHSPLTKVNGVLITDFSMTEIERQIATKFKEVFLSMGLMIITAVIVLRFLLNRLVINRLEKLVGLTKFFSKGDFDKKVTMVTLRLQRLYACPQPISDFSKGAHRMEEESSDVILFLINRTSLTLTVGCRFGTRSPRACTHQRTTTTFVRV